MKRSRFAQEQIIGVLKEHQTGASASDLCRKHGISDATFYTWRSKYGGMEVSDAQAAEARGGPETRNGLWAGGGKIANEISNSVAAQYGLLVMYAMDMYRVDAGNLTPVAAEGLGKSGWNVLAYIVGKDHLPFVKGKLVTGEMDVYYGYVAERNGEIVAAIRGTDGLVEWIEDAEFLPVGYAPLVQLPPGPQGAKVEEGFWSVYKTMCLIDRNGAALGALHDAITQIVPANSKVTVVGHSLGSTLATYLALELARGMLGSRVTACLFASPHPGNQDFATYVDKTVTNYRLFNYILDVVPHVPYSPGYSSLPRRTVLRPATAEATIKLGVGCNHHVICYCAMLDYEATKPYIVAPPEDEANSAACVVGPEVGRPTLAKLLLSGIGDALPI